MKITFNQQDFLQAGDFLSFKERLDQIADASFSLKDLEKEINYRQLVYWNNEGLLITDARKDKLKEFDFFEFCWIHLVNLLRSFGMSTQSVLSIKEALLEKVDWLLFIEEKGALDKIINYLPPEEHQSFMEFIRAIKTSADRENAQASLFMILILDYVMMRSPISMLINKDGDGLIFKEDKADYYERNEECKEFLNGSYLKISLNEIIWKFMKPEIFEPRNNHYKILSESEQKIILAMREEGIKELSVVFNPDNEPVRIEVTKEEKVQIGQKLLELIKKNQYQEITIKSQNGQIAYCENTVKSKLK